MTSKRTIALALIILLASSVTTITAYAGGVEMPGDYGNTGVTGGSGSGGSGGGHYPKWMKYDKKATLEDAVPMVPQYRGAQVDGGYSNPTEPPYIDAECHNQKSGAKAVNVSSVPLLSVHLGDTP